MINYNSETQTNIWHIYIFYNYYRFLYINTFITISITTRHEHKMVICCLQYSIYDINA